MDVVFQPASEAARLVHAGEITAAELTEAVLARIAAVDPALHSVVEVRRDRAPAEGRGAFAGVPVTVKEAIDVAGMRTTWGSPAFKDHVATADAVVVQRLERAGAGIIGKTNVATMLGDVGQTGNEVYGVTTNPWDAARAPGGSSGGSAAALAAGLTFLEYGSDLAGSVRVPAAMCGVYGLRPTAGTVPLTGFHPPGTPALPTEQAYLSTLGPLARSAADLRMALRATGGPDGPAALAHTWRLAPPRHGALRDFRVGVVLDHPAAPVRADVGEVLSAAVDTLAGAGASIVEGWPDGVDAGASAAAFGFQVDAFFTLQQAAGGAGVPLAEFAAQEATRMAIRAAWQHHFASIDVFLCPVTFTTAIAHDIRPFGEREIDGRPYTDLAFWITHASLAGLPALSAPVGRTTAGMPVGLQVIGPMHEDDTVITFAERLAELVGGFEPPPIQPTGRK
jgi:amidase